MVKLLSVTPHPERADDILVKFEVDGNARLLTLNSSGNGTSIILDCTVEEIKQHLSDLRIEESLEFQLDFMEEVFPGAWYCVHGCWVQPVMRKGYVQVIELMNNVLVMKIGKDTIEYLTGGYKQNRFASVNGIVVVGSDPRNVSDMSPSSVFNNRKE
jgi:hypothetical protein